MENKSTHKVEVVKIKKILDHPNADKMKIVKIWGFTCCVGLNQFKEGDLVAYLQPDSIVPPTKEYVFLNKGESLDDFPERRRRITVKKLRGVISQGLLMPAPEGSKEGDDVAEIMNITHYEPAPFSKGKGGGKINSGEQDKTPEGYYPHYDVDNFNRYMNVFEEIDCEIICHEKIHGCLEENTNIETEDGVKTIREICEEKYRGKVKCFDLEKEKNVFSRISNHFIESNNNDWYEIELDNGKKLTVTSEHYIWLPDLNCYRKVKDLKEKDEVLLF